MNPLDRLHLKCRCGAPLYVPFTRADGTPSKKKLIARGAVFLRGKVHLGKGGFAEVTIRLCITCAADGLVEWGAQVNRLLVDPSAPDPEASA